MGNEVTLEFSTSFYKKLQNGFLGIPQASPISNSSATYPFVIVGDEAFALSENILRPYGGKNLNHKNIVLNADYQGLQDTLNAALEF